MIRLCAAVLVSSFMLTAGCASTPKPSEKERTTPPTLIVSSRPEFRTSKANYGGRALDIAVEVDVDATGMPNLQTLRVTGKGAEDNRDPIHAWLRSARFHPAQRDGLPVAGKFQVRFRTTVQLPQ